MPYGRHTRSVRRWAPIAARAGRRYYNRGRRMAVRGRYGRFYRRSAGGRRLYARMYARRTMLRNY